MSLVPNERRNLRASKLASCGTSCLTTGVLAPIVAALLGFTPTLPNWVAVTLIALVAFGNAALLYYLAYRTLGGLQS